jgi:hypothetical protein
MKKLYEKEEGYRITKKNNLKNTWSDDSRSYILMSERIQVKSVAIFSCDVRILRKSRSLLGPYQFHQLNQ